MKLWVILLLSLVGFGALAYPLDAVDETGIRRLEYYRKIVTGELNRTPVPRGARLPMSAIAPRLTDSSVAVQYDQPDNDLSRAIAKVLGDKAPYYAVSIIDLSNPASPVYGEHNADIRRNFGSIGKLLVAVSWFQLLADYFPDVADRERLLRNTWITADAYVNTDHHKVFVYDNDTGQRAFRTLRVGDHALLWEWLDWMLSASNNAAAAMMQKQLVLLDEFGLNYPPTPEQEAAFFAATERKALGERFLRLMVDPNSRNGVDSTLLRQGSLFTWEGKKRMPGTNSYGNTREVARLLYRLERGALVDLWSSTEIKRLLYMTQKRIRYASHPALNEYAVYYKSGSLYKCKEEPGFICKEYAGNDYNLLASVGIVEGPVDGNEGQHYIFAVSSNELRKNSAVAHQTLALRIHRMLEARQRDGKMEYPALTHTTAFDFSDTVLIGEAPEEAAPGAAETIDHISSKVLAPDPVDTGSVAAQHPLAPKAAESGDEISPEVVTPDPVETGGVTSHDLLAAEAAESGDDISPEVVVPDPVNTGSVTSHEPVAAEVAESDDEISPEVVAPDPVATGSAVSQHMLAPSPEESVKEAPVESAAETETSVELPTPPEGDTH